MVEGPLILKTDSGPGRMSNSVKNTEFQQKSLEKTIFTFLGLPNGSSTTQDMDQSYAMFQPAYHRSVVCVASVNIAERMLARKKAKSNREPPKAADFCLMTEERLAEDIERFCDVFEDAEDEMTIVVEKKHAMYISQIATYLQ